MQETFILLAAEAPCPSCGCVLERTTLLCPERAGALPEILVERPGLWCRDCGCAALDAATVATPQRHTAPGPRKRAA